MRLTYGAEFEFADIRRDKELPTGATWNTKDYSIVSSTGIANDPKGKLYNLGGEINTEPTDNIQEQVDILYRIVESRKEANVNYRSNLHLHIGAPEFTENLDMMKQVLRFVDKWQEEVYPLIEPIPKPDSADKGAMKRYKRRKVSHQQKVPKDRVERALQASTFDEFFAAHAPTGAKGQPLWGLTTRAGINLLQLKETGTIEFRHFTCTKSGMQLLDCFCWVHLFFMCALDDGDPIELFKSQPWDFPKFQLYDHNMELGYQYTNFDKNSRKTVESRLSELSKHLDLETCSASDVVNLIPDSE